MCFRKSLAHPRKTQLTKAAWAPQLGAPPVSTIAAAARDISRAIMCRSPLCHAVITASANRIRLIGSVFLARRHVLTGFAQYAVEDLLKSHLGEDDERLSGRSCATCATLCHCATRFSWHSGALLITARRRRLVQPFAITCDRGDFTYYLIYPKNRLRNPSFRTFRQWLVQQTLEASRDQVVDAGDATAG